MQYVGATRLITTTAAQPTDESEVIRESGSGIVADNSSGSEKDPAPLRVHCRECLKGIAPSEAYQPEAEDYALYFCGLECFSKWRERAEKEIAPGDDKNAN